MTELAGGELCLPQLPHNQVGAAILEYLDKQSNVMGGPRKIRSRGSWSHIVSKATDA